MAQNFAIYPKKIEEDPSGRSKEKVRSCQSDLQKRSRPQLRPKLTRWLPA